MHACTTRRAVHSVPHPTMDGIGVEDRIQELHTHPAHLLISHRPLPARLLEPPHDGLLDFVQVVHTLGGIQDDVGTSAIGRKGPNLRASVTSHPWVSAR